MKNVTIIEYEIDNSNRNKHTINRINITIYDMHNHNKYNTYNTIHNK